MALSNKTWTNLLIASLALNLFLVALIGVHVLGRRSHQRRFDERHLRDEAQREGALRDRRPGREDEAGAGLLRHMVDVLGGPKDARVRAVLADEHATRRETQAALLAARHEVHEALVAEPFDAERLGNALGKLRETSSKQQADAQSALVTLARQLTPEERARLRKRP
jgi:uncharacterized membrane protein